jgi:hypothetical protein
MEIDFSLKYWLIKLVKKILRVEACVKAFVLGRIKV